MSARLIDAGGPSLAEEMSLLSTAELDAALAGFDHEQLLFDWGYWGRPAQLPPPQPWSIWLILSGRGFGKTRAGAEWVRSIACGSTPLAAGSHSRIAICAETTFDARNVIVEGESGILASHPKAFRPTYEPSLRRLTWPNGAIATTYNGTEPDQLRGPQHDAALCDELAKWRYAQEAWDQLQFGLRLGENPLVVITTTPRPIPIIKELKEDDDCVITQGSTLDNRGNLPPKFLKSIISKYGGTRLGRQEIFAEILDDVPGALWTRAMIDATRVKPSQRLPDFSRVVVGVDPSGTRGDPEAGNNAVGIIVAARGVDGLCYILDDWSCDLGPEGWGRRVCEAYAEYRADKVVAEINFGGAMVEAVIRASNRSVAVKVVTASRGKVARAEPVSALYEQGRVRHVGNLGPLEDEMCNMTPSGFLGRGSPDRMDASVWAITELMLGDSDYSWDNL